MLRSNHYYVRRSKLSGFTSLLLGCVLSYFTQPYIMPLAVAQEYELQAAAEWLARIGNTKTGNPWTREDLATVRQLNFSSAEVKQITDHDLAYLAAMPQLTTLPYEPARVYAKPRPVAVADSPTAVEEPVAPAPEIPTRQPFEVPDLDGADPHVVLMAAAGALRASDLDALVRISGGDAMYQLLETQWRQRPTEALTEDDRAQFAGLVQMLTHEDAEDQLMAMIEPQLAQWKEQLDALTEIAPDMAAAKVKNAQGLEEQGVQKIVDLFGSVAQWLQQAELSSPERARQAVGVIVNLGRELDLSSLDEAMQWEFSQVLDKAGLTLASLKQLFAVYGLSIDGILDSFEAETLSNDGEQASVRTRVMLFGEPYETETVFVKAEGQWKPQEALATLEEVFAGEAEAPATAMDSSSMPQAVEPADPRELAVDAPSAGFDLSGVEAIVFERLLVEPDNGSAAGLSEVLQIPGRSLLVAWVTWEAQWDAQTDSFTIDADNVQLVDENGVQLPPIGTLQQRAVFHPRPSDLRLRRPYKWEASPNQRYHWNVVFAVPPEADSFTLRAGEFEHAVTVEQPAAPVYDPSEMAKVHVLAAEFVDQLQGSVRAADQKLATTIRPLSHKLMAVTMALTPNTGNTDTRDRFVWYTKWLGLITGDGRYVPAAGEAYAGGFGANVSHSVKQNANAWKTDTAKVYFVVPADTTSFELTLLTTPVAAGTAPGTPASDIAAADHTTDQTSTADEPGPTTDSSEPAPSLEPAASNDATASLQQRLQGNSLLSRFGVRLTALNVTDGFATIELTDAPAAISNAVVAGRDIIDLGPSDLAADSDRGAAQALQKVLDAVSEQEQLAAVMLVPPAEAAAVAEPNLGPVAVEVDPTPAGTPPAPAVREVDETASVTTVDTAPETDLPSDSGTQAQSTEPDIEMATAQPAEADPDQDRKQLIKAIQLRLAELNYEPGPADGIAGRGTRQAVLDYQAAAGIKANDKLTAALLEHLQSSSAVTNPKASIPWTLDTSPVVGIALFDNATDASWWRPGAGEAFADLFGLGISASGKLAVADRTRVATVVDGEIAEGGIARSLRRQVRNETGADYLIVGTVTEFAQEKGGVSVGGFGIGEKAAHLSLTLRLINVASGKVLRRQTIVAASEGIGFRLGIYKSGFQGALKSERRTAAGKAIRAGVERSVEYLECTILTEGPCSE